MHKATRENIQIHMRKECLCLTKSSCPEFGNAMLTFKIYSRAIEDKMLKKNLNRTNVYLSETY